jgi:hypothetical protein
MNTHQFELSLPNVLQILQSKLKNEPIKYNLNTKNQAVTINLNTEKEEVLTFD